MQISTLRKKVLAGEPDPTTSPTAPALATPGGYPDMRKIIYGLPPRKFFFTFLIAEIATISKFVGFLI
jgi:hypothetical protein